MKRTRLCHTLAILPLLLLVQVVSTQAQDEPSVSTYQNSLQKFSAGESAHVAFMGGSITEMNGYRPILIEKLQAKFPETDFTFTNAGIASTCSTTGSFRVNSDLFEEGALDLLLLEFAVNDDQDARHSITQAQRGFEGIIRNVRRQQPQAEIVVIYFCNPSMVQLYSDGETPPSIQAHSAVAQHYGLAEVNVAKDLSEQISDGAMTWAQYGGTHPKKPGNQFAADSVWQTLNKAWESSSKETKPIAYSLPEKMVDPFAYQFAHWLDWDRVPHQPEWTRSHPDWAKLPGQFRTRYSEMPICHSTIIGSALEFEFDGTAIGLFVLAGPDAGMVEVTIDDESPKTIDLYHHFSKGLHYPRTVMLADELEARTHRIRIAVSPEANDSSQGHAVRILQIGVNGPPSK